MEQEVKAVDAEEVVEIDTDNTITTEDREFLDFELNDVELLALGRLGSSKHRELKKLETEKKDMQDHFKNLIGGVQAEIDRINRLIDTGVENREVDVVVKKDYGNRKIHFIHDGVVVLTKEMTDYDFDNRPKHILPPEVQESAEDVEEADETLSAALDDAFGNLDKEKAEERAQEIATKEAANQVPSGNVNEYSEAKGEVSALNQAALSQ